MKIGKCETCQGRVGIPLEIKCKEPDVCGVLTHEVYVACPCCAVNGVEGQPGKIEKDRREDE